jgi:hypothetical protein
VGLQSFGFLASTVILVVASMIFAALCPPQIKDFTETQWLYANKRSLVHYWPLAWTWPKMRATCGVLYVGGGLAFLLLSIWKLGEASYYAWQYLRLG